MEAPARNNHWRPNGSADDHPPHGSRLASFRPQASASSLRRVTNPYPIRWKQTATKQLTPASGKSHGGRSVRKPDAAKKLEKPASPVLPTVRGKLDGSGQRTHLPLTALLRIRVFIASAARRLAPVSRGLSCWTGPFLRKTRKVVVTLESWVAGRLYDWVSDVSEPGPLILNHPSASLARSFVVVFGHCRYLVAGPASASLCTSDFLNACLRTRQHEAQLRWHSSLHFARCGPMEPCAHLSVDCQSWGVAATRTTGNSNRAAAYVRFFSCWIHTAAKTNNNTQASSHLRC